jgi:quinoprotein relay system zinc metallohydrolase 2
LRSIHLLYLTFALILPGLSHAALDMKEVAPGVYVHQGAHEDLSEGYHGDICNIGFVVGSNGVAVIDSGGSHKVGTQLLEAIRKVTTLPVLYVINTHVHPDHIFGNTAFLAENPAYIGHAKLADAMERRRESYMRSNASWLGAAFEGSAMVKPTMTVDDKMEVDLGGRTLHITAYPVAHTNTDITVMDLASATVWTGDLLFVDRTPSVDGDIKGWISVIDQLKGLPAQRMIPGHGNVPTDWKAALDKEQHYLSLLLTDIRASIKNGVIMEKTMDTAAASEKDKWLLFDIVNRRNVNMLYPALEWE